MTGRLSAAGRVRWGFIGAGDVTEVKSGPAFSLVPGSSVSVVMRRSADKARDYAARHGIPRWTTNAEDVVGADDVDAVYVATPPSSHAMYVAMAAAAGKPVYVEKPMARTAAEGAAMIEACQAAGVPLYVAYYRRLLPRFELARRRIQDGSLGEARFVDLRLSWPPPTDRAAAGWRWEPEVAGQGLLLDLGSHAFDLIDHWLGPVAKVSGHSVTRTTWSHVPDQVVAAFQLESGALGTATFDFVSSEPEDSLTVRLSRGRVSVPVFADGPVSVTRTGGGTEEVHLPHPRHVQEPLVRAIVGELLGSGAVCPSTGVSAQRTQRVLDAILTDLPPGA